MDQAVRDRLLRIGLWLEYCTLGWNVAGVFVLAIAAMRSHSPGLAGFGLDSLIEIGASTVVTWQLRSQAGERIRVSLRLIAIAFLMLAIYIGAQLSWELTYCVRPGTSRLGLIWLMLTVLAMLLLAAAKLRVGRAIGNSVLSTEARVTLVDAMLALSVLVGVVLNANWGLWWADDVSSACILVYAVVEGMHAWGESRQ